MLEADAALFGAGGVFVCRLGPVGIGQDKLQVQFPVLPAILERHDMVGMRHFTGHDLPAREGAPSALLKEKPVNYGLRRLRVGSLADPLRHLSACEGIISQRAAPGNTLPAQQAGTVRRPS